MFQAHVGPFLKTLGSINNLGVYFKTYPTSTFRHIFIILM